MNYLYILGTILFTVYGQLILKWRLKSLPPFPEPIFDKIFTMFKYVFDPFIFSGFAAAFIASFFWMAALSKFELSYAYPFMSLSFVFVTILSFLIFHEIFTSGKIIGLILIMIGVFISSRY